MLENCLEINQTNKHASFRVDTCTRCQPNSVITNVDDDNDETFI